MQFYFDKFKKYAQFLLENKEVLEKLTNDYFKRVRTSSIPMMRFLEHLPAEQHKKITDKNIESFLQHSLSDTTFEDSIIIIEQWKANELLNVPREEIEISDILTVTNFRKQLYIDFLNSYTQDLALFRSIVAELDEFHMQFQKYAFDSYVAIHQEELANENQFISSLINNSVDGILAFDKQLKITEFNQVLEKWHGLKKEDVIGKEVLNVFSPYKGTEEESSLQKALKGERIYIPESPFLDRKGFYEANIVPVYDSKGRITGGLVITHETTQRKEAEEKLRETKHLLQEITDAVPNLIYINDFIANKNIFVNKEFGVLTGYTSEDAKSFDKDSFLQLVHPKDLSIIYDREKAYENLRKGELYEVTVRLKHKDGSWRWLRTKSKIFKYDEKGKPLQVLGVTEDVSEAVEAQQTIQHQNEELAAALEELQTAEEQLREINEELEHRVEIRTRELAESNSIVKQREEQIRLITDAMPVLISYLRSDKTYGFVNKAYENLHNQKKEDIIGKPMREVIGEKAYKNKLPLLERALKGEFVSSEILQDYDGSGRKWVKISIVPHEVNGEIVGVFSLVEDITEFKNVQLELEGKNSELARKNTDLDNFIYTASHDLKSPITNMQGLMMLLNKSALEKVELKERNMLDMMDTSIQRLQKTIGDLVEVTKVHKELEEAVEEPVRFEEISRDVKDDIYSLIQESNAVIKEDYKVEEVFYKKSSLRSILYNLLSNAMKYRSPDKPLEVELKTFIQGDSVVLSVKDSGLGLSSKQQQKLFTLFKRMHQHVEGTGVGLFMIKRIVDSNGGKIEVKSEEGKGTEFLVFLAKASKK